MLIANRRGPLATLAALTALVVVACGGGTDGSEVASGSGNPPGSGTGTDQPDLSGNGSGTGTGSGSSGGVTTITPDKACANSSAAADAIPAVVEMVVDTSGSMLWGADGNMRPRAGMTKWDITSAALKEAVAKLPASIAVGVNFFPNTSRRDMMCLNNRIAVPLALLGAANSAQRRAFNTAIDNAQPNGGTPTHGAFLFGEDTVKATKLAGRKFVLLITDGMPTYPLDCSGDGMSAIDNGPLIAAVADAFTKDQVSTFVIGSPGSENARGDLSQMATKGGTAKAGCSDAGPTYCHLDMTTAADFGAALAAGLAEVAGKISTCDYAIPPAPNGKTINPGEVNVLYTKGDGSQGSIPQDATGDCKSGWKYDDAQNPTKITLCGTDCDKVMADQGAKIDLIFGCTTETNVPVK